MPQDHLRAMATRNVDILDLPPFSRFHQLTNRWFFFLLLFLRFFFVFFFSGICELLTWNLIFTFARSESEILYDFVISGIFGTRDIDFVS